ncbi:MAG: zinc-dependent metalloprotease [Pseudomonadaceae bacterium]|nr:zinc-dependent metalloprotease [Pseudomonadaceae bacterium]
MYTTAFKILSLGAVLLTSACGGGGGGGGGSSNGTANAPPVATAVTPAPAPPAPEAQPEIQPPATDIKLLALYSPGVAEQFNSPDLRISHLVNVANDVVTTSGVELSFSLAHIEWVDYPDFTAAPQALDDLTFANHSAFEAVEQLRATHEADLVVLFRNYANDGHCGYAWIGGFQTQGDFSNPAEADFGYSVVSANCSDYTLLHELGHNLGLAHSRRESSEGGTFDYATGYGMDERFATIMASPDVFSAPQVPRLSSPALSCNDVPCGIAHTDPAAGSDAVRALNISKDQVASYR